MAQDITADFRNVVEQKRKGHGDTRRSKLGRPTPGDTDGAPPFMQAYMKEAYTIVSQVLFLFIAFLRARSCNKSLPWPVCLPLCGAHTSTFMRGYRQSHARRCAHLIPLAWIHGRISSTLQTPNAIKLMSKRRKYSHVVLTAYTIWRRWKSVRLLPPILYRAAEPSHRPRRARRSIL